MFRITEDPSSGSLVQCLAKNYKNDSIMSIDMDKVGVMAAYSDLLCMCVVHCIWRPSYTMNYSNLVHVNGHDRIILVIFSQALYTAPWWWILCDPKHVGALLKFFIILIVSTYYILCISWIIKCLIMSWWSCHLTQKLNVQLAKVTNYCFIITYKSEYAMLLQAFAAHPFVYISLQNLWGSHKTIFRYTNIYQQMQPLCDQTSCTNA